MAPSPSNAASLAPLRRAKTARLHADLEIVMERSRDLVWLSGRLLSRVRPRPHIVGSSDGDDSVSRAVRRRIASGALPAETPRRMWAGFGNGRPCDACGNAITLTAVEHEFDFADGRTVRFHDACSETWRRAISGGRTCAVRRPSEIRRTSSGANGDATAPRSVPTGIGIAQAVTAYLAQHRGEEFCAKCLSAELFGGRDIDVPMRQVEGSGVQRFHGRCSVCGKLRLVATLPTRPAIGEAMGG